MNDARRFLIAGESWITHSIHQKGFDAFTTTSYHEGVGPLRAALEAGPSVVDYLPNHLAASQFPLSCAELDRYDAVILSDIGANTLQLHPDTFERSTPLPDRLEVLREYVARGGGLIMVGGYLSFQGIDGRARYAATPLAEVLPVCIQTTDDRVEMPPDEPRSWRIPRIRLSQTCRPVGRHSSATTVSRPSLSRSWS